MKITLLSVGSTGDVRPFVALGIALKQAGHDVTLATSREFERLATDHELRFRPLRADFLRLVQSDEGREILAGNPMAVLRAVRRTIPGWIRELLDDAWQAAQGSDAFVYHPKILAGPDMAEALQIPAFLGLFTPLIVPTREFANPILPVTSLGGPGNRLSYNLASLVEAPYRGILNRWRRETLGIPPRTRSEFQTRLGNLSIPILHAFSPRILPRPVDWPAHAFVTGYWFLNETEPSPPDTLLEFLDAGPPPVYVGFGSMASRDARRVGQTVAAALRRVGLRGIIATGWGGLDGITSGPDLHVVESVSHDWLFPRVRAVVHHGGAGTTAAGLRAGRPTLICPFFADQPFWGRRIWEQGVGPRPIPQRRLSEERLTRALRELVENDSFAIRGQAFGSALEKENGVEQTVSIIEGHVGHGLRVGERLPGT